MTSPNQVLHLIEVKSVQNIAYIGTVIKLQQKLRLKRALSYLIAKGNIAVLELAVVTRHDEVLVLANIFD